MHENIILTKLEFQVQGAGGIKHNRALTVINIWYNALCVCFKVETVLLTMLQFYGEQYNGCRIHNQQPFFVSVHENSSSLFSCK